MKDDLNPNFKPNTSRAITPDGYWITISKAKVFDEKYIISTNDGDWWRILDSELEDDRFGSNKQMLLNRLQHFATKHQLTFVLAKNDRGE